MTGDLRVAAALLPAVLVAALTGCDVVAASGVGNGSSPVRGAAGTSPAPPLVALAAPEGFRVSLEHEARPVRGPGGQALVAWESAWVLTWEPVPEAEEYAVWFGTSEGSARSPRRSVPEPRLRLEAATGTSPAERVETDRRAGLLFTSSQLLVAVSARAGGRVGPRSPWFPVGDVPPDGVPLPTGAGHADHGT